MLNPDRPRIRALIVDTSAFARRMAAQAVAAQPDMEVVGQASSGAAALQQLANARPDVVVLDLEMAGADGFETLRHLKRGAPDVPVLVFSSGAGRGVGATADALLAGADDCVLKPEAATEVASAWAESQEELATKLRAIAERARRVAARRSRTGSMPPSRAPQVLEPVRAVVVGTSAGGPEALAQILPRLPEKFPAPVLVVQHMPGGFTTALAKRLDEKCSLPVAEARHGQRVEPGRVVLAPGEFHMHLSKQHESISVLLDKGPLEHGCRPSVDALFRSAARVYGPNLLALVLTGMGSDGLEGARAVREAGGHVWIQDEESSAVWGMAGAVSRAGLALRTLTLPSVAHALGAVVAHGLSNLPFAALHGEGS
jgi:two-component system, chemotaxis family, protein-glutamate methylesterase/glutaminase